MTLVVVMLTVMLAGCGVLRTTALPPAPTEAEGLRAFAGTVRTGADLGEIKQHCPEGLYLVADEGEYLSEQTTMLLLRVADGSGGSTLLADGQYVAERVEVTGKYPAQEVFCEALICECEDYTLVQRIAVVSQ